MTVYRSLNKRVIAAIGALCLASCVPSFTGRNPTEAVPTRTRLVTSDVLPAVTAALPLGMVVTDTGGIDTASARAEGPGLVINVDYGRTGGTQTCGGLSDCEERVVTIQRRQASYVRYSHSRVVAGFAYAERLDFYLPFTSLAPAQPPPPTGLLLNAFCADRAACDQAEKIVRSVRFAH